MANTEEDDEVIDLVGNTFDPYRPVVSHPRPRVVEEAPIQIIPDSVDLTMETYGKALAAAGATEFSIVEPPPSSDKSFITSEESFGGILLDDLQRTLPNIHMDIGAGTLDFALDNVISILRGHKGLNLAMRELLADGDAAVDSLFTGFQVSPENIDKAIVRLESVQELNDEDRTIVGTATGDLTKFLLNYGAAGKVLDATGIKRLKTQLSKAVIGGVSAEMLTFDPDEPRLSNLIHDNLEQFPELREATTAYLAADVTDETAESLFKQAMEGFLIGGAFEGLGRVAAKTLLLAKAARRKIVMRGRGTTPEDVAMPTGKGDDILNATERVDVTAAEIADALVEESRNIKISKTTLDTAGSPFGTVDVGVKPTDQVKVEALMEIFESNVRKINADAGSPLDEANILAKLAWFEGRAMNSLTTGRRIIKPGVGGPSVLKTYDDGIEAAAQVYKLSIPQRVRKLGRAAASMVYDRSANIKRSLLKSAGDEGQKAVMHLELAQGASLKGEQRFAAARDIIYSQLKKVERADLDALIQYRRMGQIYSYKPKYRSPYKGANVTDFAQARELMQERLGPAQYDRLMKRADAYFDAHQTNIDNLLTEGIITEADHIRLSRFDYSPIEFINEIDEIIKLNVGKDVVTVRSSGLAPLGRGAAKYMETDSSFMLAQTMLRTEGRIFRNRANVALLDVARTHPANPVVRVGKKPESGLWTKISVMENGEKKNMWLNQEFVDEWIVNSSQMPSRLATLAQAISLSPLVRPFATGINPAFIFSNFPRDMMYIWLTTSQYSAILPKAALQLGKDMVEVAGDAFTRKGVWKDYIDEGGGMALLTHQGRIGAQNAVGSKLQRVQHVLGYLNETSEIWLRLALRNRALKNGLSPTEATWQARRYIDFSQGGWGAKAIDNGIPYLNASAQGIRGFVRAAGDDPALLAAKISQTMAVWAGANFANRKINPEGFSQVPNDIKNRNTIIMTPWWYLDHQGNKRHLYFNIPIDHTVIPLKALTDASIARYVDGELPRSNTMSILSSLGNIVPVGNIPPSMSAAFALVGNYDWWRQDNVWKGPNVVPVDEYYGAQHARPTPNLPKDIAELTRGGLIEVSPARLTAAFGAVVPSNVYTNTMGFAYEQVFSNVPPDIRDQAVIDMLANMPFLRRWLSVTHPASNILDDVDRVARERAGELKTVTDQLDTMFVEMKSKTGVINAREVSRWISAQSPLDQAALKTRFTNLESLDRIWRTQKFEDVPFLPKKSYWITLVGMDVQARAAVFLEQWREAGDDETNGVRRRAAMRKITKTLPGFNSKQFSQAIQLEASQQGVKLPFGF